MEIAMAGTSTGNSAMPITPLHLGGSHLVGELWQDKCALLVVSHDSDTGKPRFQEPKLLGLAPDGSQKPPDFILHEILVKVRTNRQLQIQVTLRFGKEPVYPCFVPPPYGSVNAGMAG
jgi:hypothetical protein